MKKSELLIGFLIGIAAATLGAWLFVTIFTDYDLFGDFGTLRNDGLIGKIITLGAILNIIAFFGLIRLGQETMARGVVAATIVLTLITLFL